MAPARGFARLPVSPSCPVPPYDPVSSPVLVSAFFLSAVAFIVISSPEKKFHGFERPGNLHEPFFESKDAIGKPIINHAKASPMTDPPWFGWTIRWPGHVLSLVSKGGPRHAIGRQHVDVRVEGQRVAEV